MLLTASLFTAADATTKERRGKAKTEEANQREEEEAEEVGGRRKRGRRGSGGEAMNPDITANKVAHKRPLACDKRSHLLIATCCWTFLR